jgi:hypothetical protein
LHKYVAIKTSVCHVSREKRRSYNISAKVSCSVAVLDTDTEAEESLFYLPTPLSIYPIAQKRSGGNNTTQRKQEGAVQCPLGIGLSLSLALYGAALTYIMWIRLNEYTGFSPLFVEKGFFNALYSSDPVTNPVLPAGGAISTVGVGTTLGDNDSVVH